MHALKVLEFRLILDRLAKHAETPLGSERCAEAAPAFDWDAVSRRQRETQEAYLALSGGAVPSLYSIGDLRPMLRRASKGGVLGGTELGQVLSALAALRGLSDFLINRAEELPELQARSVALPRLPKLERDLSDSLDPSGELRDEASVALGELRRKKRGAAARITERIQQYLSGKTRELLSDPIYTIRDGRYVLPLKAENRGKIRGIVHDTSATGQTIYVEPEDVLQLGNALREVESQERQEELRILTKLSALVGAEAEPIRIGIEIAGELDEIFARGRLAFEMKALAPALDNRDKPFIEIDNGKHPLLAAENCVPLTVRVGQSANVLITGPNTGGKTVAIKCTGLFVLMAQCGMFLPAHQVRLSPFRQIWADIGDEQSLHQSLSTFSGHIKNIGDALRWMKPGALVLLDEVGAGTDPAEGAALAAAILREMDRKGAAIMASTHYGELKAFAYDTEGFTNAAMEFDVKTLRPTYRLLMGAPGASHALRIAERYGISSEIIESAKQELGTQAQDLAKMLEQLELAQKQARIAQGEADRRIQELRKAEERADRKLEEADEVRRSVHGKANEVIESALREIRLEAGKLFEELKRAPRDAQTQEKVRRGLEDLDRIGKDFAQEFVPVTPRLRQDTTIKRGMTVSIEGYSQAGTVMEDPRDGKATVQVGMLRITVPVNRLQLAKAVATAKARPNVQLRKAMNATTELHLRNMRAEDAVRDLEKFVDDAVLAGLPSIRIVHGKGEGILRNITREYLRKHPNIGNYQDADPGEGGHGVTIAVIR